MISRRTAMQALKDRHAGLLARTTGTLRAVVELHHLTEAGDCDGCDTSGYEPDAPPWPCRTINLISASLTAITR